MKVLVTGTAGFIGNALALRLRKRGDEVVGLDNLNDYYDVGLKQARLARLDGDNGFVDVRADLADRGAVERVFADHKPERVVHLAAQAGVRYAAENPHVYTTSNVTGFLQRPGGLQTPRRRSISCSRPPARCTAPTARCPFRSISQRSIR